MARLAGLAVALLLPVCVQAATPLHQRIDQLISSRKDFAKYQAPPASDAEFFRRVHLDLAGCIPTASATRAFLADRSPDKRRAVIDRLLASPEHARHMATVFDVLLMERIPDRLVPRAVWIRPSSRAMPAKALCHSSIVSSGMTLIVS
jgi:hypothetical protein